MSRLVKIWKIDLLNYSLSLKLQKYLANLHQTNAKDPDTLLLLEHPPVYTIGIRRKDYTLEDEERLRKTGNTILHVSPPLFVQTSAIKGAEFFKTNRGGLITFHGPGQMVAYPIINLKHYKTSMRCYVCRIEHTVIDVCNKLGLNGETSPHTGVWIGDNKARLTGGRFSANPSVFTVGLCHWGSRESICNYARSGTQL